MVYRVRDSIVVKAGLLSGRESESIPSLGTTHGKFTISTKERNISKNENYYK